MTARSHSRTRSKQKRRAVRRKGADRPGERRTDPRTLRTLADLHDTPQPRRPPR
ncbi:MAG TPA: hypothetical protein PK434_15830 [Microthrixaceae bacterium]|nr:hypothetical protein [Microthrixaceae bacterium]MCO5307201.1 hypothetical protein [Microthrixaceae bacterium]HPG16146.1 hypothetical protein [Microthrixaceae bacterium]